MVIGSELDVKSPTSDQQSVNTTQINGPDFVCALQRDAQQGLLGFGSGEKKVRRMKKQRGGDKDTEEVSGHCLFYSSSMSLAPSVGCNPSQQRLQS